DIYTSLFPEGGDPCGTYVQARSAMHELLRKAEKTDGVKSFIKEFRFYHAVCFMQMGRQELRRQAMPPEALPQITIAAEDLRAPEAKFEEIFRYSPPGKRARALSGWERDQVLHKLLCPRFEAMAMPAHEANEALFVRCLREQTRILDFLAEQKVAAISGAAGTGKTLIAVEKARREARGDRRVLFLCFNRFLCEHLRRAMPDPNVDYFNVDAWSHEVLGRTGERGEGLYDELAEWVLEKADAFPYGHVVIDEGQDFARPKIEASGLLAVLRDVIEGKDGSFYLFYDKWQLVQSVSLPKVIRSAECRLVLHQNCRNTLPIAHASMGSLRHKDERIDRRISLERCPQGEAAAFHIA
ncbi:MAG: PhoH family protein, partial [Duodenibacillus sp.]|nr:PhoH family protein [Duodenibacillus sp.]